MSSKKVIGLDYGTLSARAVILDTQTGEMCGTAHYDYPHGVMEDALPSGKKLPDFYALADPKDYRDALIYCVQGAIKDGNIDPNDIVGIGIDATTYTMITCDEQGRGMCEHDEYKDEPMAYIKMWKHHAPFDQADRLQKIHEKEGAFPGVDACGGTVNCEWSIPKILETYELAPKLFNDTYRFCNLGEWLVKLLTGEFINDIHTLGFKSMWTPEHGVPADEAFDAAAPGFAAGLKEKFWGEPKPYDVPCAYVSKEAAELLGIPEGIPVASPVGDGSMTAIFFCLSQPNAVAITQGTSLAIAFFTEQFKELHGVNGAVAGGMFPGLCGWDAGQPCTGDMFDWFMKNQLPSSAHDAAKAAGMNPHAYLSKLAQENKPYNNELTVLDWFNGNRGILNDQDVRGVVAGMSLNTRPQDIYCALLQGVSCGTRKILDYLADNDVNFEKIIVCGGVALKNRFSLQQFANIMQRPVYLSDAQDITARSSGILGAIVSGIPAEVAVANMANVRYEKIEPDTDHASEYERIYKRWCLYHDACAEVQRKAKNL